VPRILVVDDDDSIRESIRIGLSCADIETVGAESGEHALEVFPRTAFDGAIVDLMMPGMDGLETIEALRALAPGLPAVLISGALMRADPNAPDLLKMSRRLPDVARLAKPFTIDELLHTVRNCIAVAA
jgi:two-component system cell cycle sensor histidine kinase/response regulator CckA